MNIIDLDGKPIEVTDLDAAIEQAAMFSEMKHADKTFEKIDVYLNTYWTDMLSKLKNIKEM